MHYRSRAQGKQLLAPLGGLAILVLFAGPARPQQPSGESAPATSAPQAAPAEATPAQGATVGAVALPASTYAGSETCATCHEEVFKALGTTPHGKRNFAELSEHGCETCHGPASAHTENPDDPELRPRFTRFSAEERANTCTTCHNGGKQALWKSSAHEANGVSCDTCHSIHAFKSEQAQLAMSSVTDLCSSCHTDVRAELWKTSHHPIREGKMSCADCHNPHGTTTDAMITAASATDQCYTCHTEKRGPFLWEHPPVRENCMNCHAPHGSNHLKLQKTSVPYLCQQCHSNTRHPATLYDGTTLADQSRASNRTFNRACLDCHPAVHGSNHPSGPYLGR